MYCIFTVCVSILNIQNKKKIELGYKWQLDNYVM